MKANTIIGLLIMVLMAACAHVVSSLYGNETDRFSLLEFKKAISLDPQQALISWNDSIHFCNWEGVLCTTKNPRRVAFLNLTNRGLVGQISPSLGNLSFLQNLVLPKNAFTADIPPSLGHLHRLYYLYLSNNTLQGSIPSFANCSNLKVLWLDHNNLVGQIPSDFPHNLQELQLAYNNLSGTIPSSLANITTLKLLHCVSNNIEGNIPDDFAKFRRLQFLYVGGNRLVGRFEQAILNISTLVGLSLAENNLTGEIPPSVGNYLPNLQRLLLAHNLFRGHIPASLINASKLYYIDLSRNNFIGVVPGSIGKLTKLSWLNLELNKLEAQNNEDWEFMYNLSNCTELRSFSLHLNCFEGPVPASVGNLSIQLQSLLLGGNKLTGSFPSGIANLPNLNYLGLESNQFTGMVPEWLGSLQKLQRMHLNDNNFTGFIPTALSNLSQLGYLYLDSNKFGGHIPPTLGNLQMLEALNVSNNNLNGRVPRDIFRIPAITLIDLSFNNLDGQLPSSIGDAKQLVSFILSSNKLSGDIPNTLGNCESMEDIELDSNIFSGSIPTSLANIKNLQFLNLSNNRLTGSIPGSLGNLQFLEQLDLSSNHLDGEVPKNGIFKNASIVQIDGNQGLCGGTLGLNLVTCFVMPLKSSAKRKLAIALNVVIVAVIMVSIGVAIVVLLLRRGKQNRNFASTPSFGVKFPKISYNDLFKGTEGFSSSNLIAKGGYSSVYKGRLFQGREVVVVKVFTLETRGAQMSFITECNAIRNVRHRNLVSILTACSSTDFRGNDFKALVYEFMPRGDLHKLLHASQDDESSSNLYISLAQRLSIVVDVSDAVAYLHHNHQGSIVHCDLKPSNILLDNDMTAHVGDFGLARFKIDSAVSSPGHSYLTSSISVRGTIGYVAPECAIGGQVSTASDVYSFGVVLLEIFLRKRPTDDMFKDGLNIAKFVEMNFPSEIPQITDPELLEDQLDSAKRIPAAMKENDLECLLSVVNIGLFCTKLSQNERPNMQEVAARLTSEGTKRIALR